MLRPPTRFQQRTIWAAATGVALLVIAALLAGLVWLTGKVLGFLQPVLVPLAVAGIAAYLLDPLVRWFQRHRLSRLRAVLTVFGLSLAAALTLLAVMIPQIGNQIDEFRHSYDRRSPATGTTAAAAKRPFDEAVVDRLVQLRRHYPWLEAPIEHLLEPVAAQAVTGQAPPADAAPIQLQDTRLWRHGIDFAGDLAAEVAGWLKGSTSKVVGALGLLLGFFMVPIYLYFFLKEGSAIKEHWHDYVPLRASHFKDELVGTIQEINGYLISFFRGQVLVAFIDGILVGISLSLFRLPLGLLIGLLMAVLGVIPYIGNIICLIPACILAYIHFGDPAHQHILGSNPWAYIAGVVVIFIVVQQINSLVTAPRIVGGSVGLHPMTVIFSMLFWSLLLGGFIGALLAVPLTASIKVLFRRYIWERNLADAGHATRWQSHPGQP
jgi:predicted PurR-regulated permease PerM